MITIYDFRNLDVFNNRRRGIPHDNRMRLAVSVFVFLCWLLPGCQEGSAPSGKVDDYLLKSGSLVISEAEFSEELELKRAAYDYGIQNDPDEYNALVIDLVSQLSEELVLRCAAREKGIVVSDQELQAAEDGFRADYPDDSFEAMLLENAITLRFWKRRLGIRLLMDQLIQQELRDRIEITSQEIVAYYNRNKEKFKSIKDETALVANLRMEKAEAEYPEWIKTLEETYPVLINRVKIEQNLKTTKVDNEE
jgi:MinD-like ATPase involved in chromosome partitioning or flagellar assembly